MTTEPSAENVEKFMKEHKPFNELVDKMSPESQQSVREQVSETIKNLAVEEALQAIRDRSYTGRHPELGRMINCPVCNLRHRENERRCEQKFYIELTPPEGLTQLTARQIFGAKAFDRRRQRPRNRPKSKMHHWLRVILDARKVK